MWTSESVANVQVRQCPLSTFVINPLVHIHQKNVALDVAAKSERALALHVKTFYKLAQEKEEQAERNKQLAKARKAEKQRLEEEATMREEKRKQRERQEIEKKQAMEKIMALKKTTVGARALKNLTEQVGWL